VKRLFTILVILMVILSIITFPTGYSQKQSLDKYIILYIPGLPFDLLRKHANFSEIVNSRNISYLVLKPEPPYTALHYELLLINTSWDLKQALILDDKVLYNDSVEVEPWNAIDYGVLNRTWSQEDVLFINVMSIDPGKHNQTLNPLYNYTRSYFPSDIVIVPINRTIHWKLLDTNFTILEINGTFKVTIGDYARNVTISNQTMDTDLILINTTNRNISGINPGVFNIKIRLVWRNDTHVKLLILGSRDHRDWLSKKIGIYTKQVLPIIPFEMFKELEYDDIEWVFKQVLSFYSEMINTGFRIRTASVNYIGISIFDQLYNAYLKGYINETLLTRFSNETVDAVYNYMLTAMKFAGSSKIMIYVPYTYVFNASRRIEINGLTEIVPGLYRVDGDIYNIIQRLCEEDLEFKTLKYNVQQYVLVKTLNTAVNSGYSIGNGYLIIYPSDNPVKNLVVDTYMVTGYLIGLSHGFEAGFIDWFKVNSDLNKQIRDLNNKINELNNTISSLNGTLRATERQLGDCRAENLNITSQINDLKSEIDRLNSRLRELWIYTSIGTISIFIIVSLLYVLSSRGLKKQAK